MADPANSPGEFELATLDAHIWSELVRGKVDRRHGFHLPVVASLSSDGGPDARTVVLREVDGARRLLAFHTDARSPKLQAIRDGGLVAWVFYDARIKQQVRARGRVTVRRGEESQEAWDRTSLPSRRCYLVPSPPGAPIETPNDGWVTGLRGVNPDLAESEAGRAAFAVVETVVERMDWLFLQARGHLRASLVWNEGAQTFDRTWIIP